MPAVLKVGLTGGIAVGKSAVGEMFAALGVHVIQADEIAHQLMQPGEPVYLEVVARFGPGILHPDGSVNRSRLAELAFGAPNQPSRVQELNQFVHPAVIRRQEEWMIEVGRRNPGAIAMVEAALILEAGMSKRLSVCLFTRDEAKTIARAVRSVVGVADEVAISGFIIGGTGTKEVLLRAIGPSLAQQGIAGTLADPFLELHDSSGAIIGSNDNWETTLLDGLITTDQAATIRATTIAPTDPAESAILADLTPGVYTAIVRGVNGGTGVGLAEVYDLNQESPALIENLSTRGFVQTGTNILIGGFIIGGSEMSTVVVRALGPSLIQAGIPNALADPTMELHDANGALLASNDNWADTQESEIQASGLAPTNPLESAIESTLAPGNYTATVAGKNGGVGVGLVEAYKVQ